MRDAPRHLHIRLPDYLIRAWQAFADRSRRTDLVLTDQVFKIIAERRAAEEALYDARAQNDALRLGMDKALYDARVQNDTLRLDVDSLNDRLVGKVNEVNEIRVALGRVAAFEGIVDSSTTAMLVDELVRDHEELESRIDAAMSLLSGETSEVASEVARLLGGGTRVPDDLGGLDDGR